MRILPDTSNFVQNDAMRRHNVLIRLFQIGVFLALLLFGYSHLNKPLSSWRDEELVVVIAQDSTLSDEEFSFFDTEAGPSDRDLCTEGSLKRVNLERENSHVERL